MIRNCSIITNSISFASNIEINPCSSIASNKNDLSSQQHNATSRIIANVGTDDMLARERKYSTSLLVGQQRLEKMIKSCMQTKWRFRKLWMNGRYVISYGIDRMNRRLSWKWETFLQLRLCLFLSHTRSLFLWKTRVAQMPTISISRRHWYMNSVGHWPCDNFSLLDILRWWQLLYGPVEDFRNEKEGQFLRDNHHPSAVYDRRIRRIESNRYAWWWTISNHQR